MARLETRSVRYPRFVHHRLSAVMNFLVRTQVNQIGRSPRAQKKVKVYNCTSFVLILVTIFYIELSLGPFSDTTIDDNIITLVKFIAKMFSRNMFFF